MVASHSSSLDRCHVKFNSILNGMSIKLLRVSIAPHCFGLLVTLDMFTRRTLPVSQGFLDPRGHTSRPASPGEKILREGVGPSSDKELMQEPVYFSDPNAEFGLGGAVSTCVGGARWSSCPPILV